MEQHINLHKGDTFSFAVEFEGLTNDLTSAEFTVYTNAGKTEQVLQRTIGSGITKISTGKYRVRLAPSNTSGKTPGAYPYDFKVSLNSDTFTLLDGTLVLLP